jgi:phosphatidate cytidylyltransferase
MNPEPYTIVALGVVAALGLGAGAVAAIARRSGRRPSEPATADGRRPGGASGRTVLARSLSYAALAGLLALAAWFGAPGIALLAAAIGAIGLVEWSSLGDLPVHHRVALQVTNVAIIGLVLALGAGAAEWIVGAATLAGMAWPVLRADPSRAMRDLGFAAVGTILLPGMLAHGVALAVERGTLGASTFVALAVAVAASDVTAFIVGRRFGRTPLAPSLSPNKTRAGALGNLLGAAIGVAIFAPVLIAGLGLPFAVLLVPVVALGAIWGDLLESAVKREAGRKDAGQWLPGFGGILDRVDSLLITLPLAYWSLRVGDLIGGRS